MIVIFRLLSISEKKLLPSISRNGCNHLLVKTQQLVVSACNLLWVFWKELCNYCNAMDYCYYYWQCSCYSYHYYYLLLLLLLLLFNIAKVHGWKCFLLCLQLNSRVIKHQWLCVCVCALDSGKVHSGWCCVFICAPGRCVGTVEYNA